jgi:cellulose synthase/poly-beta-1,6-N-acetylglucosamine synthase-like glycosyltransferase
MHIDGINTKQCTSKPYNACPAPVVRCRYLNEYLVFGTSPETVRKVFQQRSRWCKGQMQVRQIPLHQVLFSKIVVLSRPWPNRLSTNSTSCYDQWSSIPTSTFVKPQRL